MVDLLYRAGNQIDMIFGMEYICDRQQEHLQDLEYYPSPILDRRGGYPFIPEQTPRR